MRAASRWLLILLSIAYVHLAEAQQQAGKTPRVGVLLALSHAAISDRIQAFREGLRELGYVEGKTITNEYRYADGQFDRLPDLAMELAALKVNVIVTGGPTATRPARKATATIPIVMAQDTDPVGNGFVASLARPGGNITGMDLRDGEILGKRLELLKEAIPKSSRVGVLADPSDPGHAAIPKNIEREAHALQIQLHRMEASRPEDFDGVFVALLRVQADSLILPESPLFSQNRQRIFKSAITKRVPTAAGGSHFAEAGSLISYGANIFDVCQRSASFVDKIFQGARPQDLPVERPAKFELVINLKTAKQIGLTIPPQLLARADRVIK
jgi:putative ABC transport system substrate-binding protein